MIVDVFEENGSVVVCDDTKGRTSMLWQDALERCKAVIQTEEAMYSRYHTRKYESPARKWIPHIIRAAVAARKYHEPDWVAPACVLDIPITPKPSRIRVPGLILADS
jgi:hypothetical protein